MKKYVLRIIVFNNGFTKILNMYNILINLVPTIIILRKRSRISKYILKNII